MALAASKTHKLPLATTVGTWQHCRCAMPRMTLAGGKGHMLLAECLGALLQSFDTPGACVLRLVCREFQAAVAAHPGEDRGTVILGGSIGGWRECFPRARCANVRMFA